MVLEHRSIMKLSQTAIKKCDFADWNDFYRSEMFKQNIHPSNGKQSLRRIRLCLKQERSSNRLCSFLNWPNRVPLDPRETPTSWRKSTAANYNSRNGVTTADRRRRLRIFFDEFTQRRKGETGFGTGGTCREEDMINLLGPERNTEKLKF